MRKFGADCSTRSHKNFLDSKHWLKDTCPRTSDTQVFARAKTCIKIIESSRVYRKGASLSRVPDAITLRDSINLLKMQCMHAQRSESGFTPHERYTSFCPSKNLH